MATNLVYRNTDAKNRVEDLGATLAPGVARLSKADLPVVTITGSADYVKSETIDGMTLSGIPAGGIGLTAQQVTLAFDGTWEFAEASVAGVSAASMTQGTAVYLTVANALTSTEGTNTLFGYVDVPPDYDRTRGMVPIRIGA